MQVIFGFVSHLIEIRSSSPGTFGPQITQDAHTVTGVHVQINAVQLCAKKEGSVLKKKKKGTSLEEKTVLIRGLVA